MNRGWLKIGVMIASALAVAAIILFAVPFHRIFYSQIIAPAQVAQVGQHIDPPAPPAPIVTHIATPAAVKAIYMTACIASTPRLRNKLIALTSGTEINSLVIDIKDYTGTLAYASTTMANPPGTIGPGCRIHDLQAFIASLHEKGLYTIARVTVFQDPFYAALHPDLAVQSRSHPGQPWRDRKGLAYIDPDFPGFWDYISGIAIEAHAIGFDEVNFDYIRFPSDGDMSDAMFALPASSTKVAVITDFFKYLRSNLEPQQVTMSADLFGQTTVNYDDMGIGQVLEDALPYFDYVSPMVYPSHFVPGFEGYENPALYPYQVINSTMKSALIRAVAASSSPDKLRPWLQAFDLGAVYTPDMIRTEMRAVYDAGLTSWMLWDPANIYGLLRK